MTDARRRPPNPDGIPDQDPDRLAAVLRTTIGTLVRATRGADLLAPIPAAVLDLLDRHGPMTTAALAAGRGVRHQTMAATVKELAEAGHLASGPDPADARKKVLTLTRKGKSTLDADRRRRDSVLSHALSAVLDEDERRVVAAALPLLDRLAAAAAPPELPGADPSARRRRTDGQ